MCPLVGGLFVFVVVTRSLIKGPPLRSDFHAYEHNQAGRPVAAGRRTSVPILILYKMTSVGMRRSSRAGLSVFKSNLLIGAGLNYAFLLLFFP